jgi:Glycosyltransferase family 92
MFNAYFDNRNQSVIRVLTFINRVNPTVKTFCQLWYDEIDEPLIVPSHEYKLLWYKHWGVNRKGSQPYLVTCSDPLRNVVPLSVSLVEHSCSQASNNLKIIYNLPSQSTKKPFAVCTKDLDFMDDQTVQVAEWIEILSILGADRIFIYVINIHPNMMKTLRYYEMLGKVKVEMMTEPKGLPNKTESLTQWLQNELISLNDCLYKHMYEYEYLIPLDIDEVIIPKRKEDKTWKNLMVHVKNVINNQTFAAFSVRNVLFLSDNNHEGEIQPEVPINMKFLQHIYRAANYAEPGVGSKSFQSTKHVLGMHNHFPLECLDSKCCDALGIETKYAQLNHYRRDCETYRFDECEDYKKNTVRDETLWKYKDELIERVNRTLKELNLKDIFLM